LAHGGQDLGSVAGASVAVILPDAHIAHRMGTILDAPRPSIEVEPALRAGRVGRRETTSVVVVPALVTEPVRGAREAGILVLTVMVRLRRRSGHARHAPAVGNSGLQVHGERGVRAFDRHEGLRLQFLGEAQERSMGVSGIGWIHALLDRRGGQDLRGDQDGMGVLVRARGQPFPGSDGSHRPAEGEPSVRPSGAASYGGAIQGQRLVSRRRGRGTLTVLAPARWQQRPPAARASERANHVEAKRVGGHRPLAGRGDDRGTMTHHGSDHTGQEEGQIRAEAMGPTWVGDGFEHVGQAREARVGQNGLGVLLVHRRVIPSIGGFSWETMWLDTVLFSPLSSPSLQSFTDPVSQCST